MGRQRRERPPLAVGPRARPADLDRVQPAQIVWAINPGSDTLEQFTAYLCRFARDYLELARVRCRLDLPATLPPATQTLAAANAYNGLTTISAGTLALSSAGSLGASFSVSIAAGATFEVSAYATYTWGASAGLTASGSTVAAVLKGGTTGVNLGSRPVTVTNLGLTALVAEDRFQLFSQPLLNGQALAIGPAPGSGLAWTNKLAVDGSIGVISVVVPCGVRSAWPRMNTGANEYDKSKHEG